MNNKESQSNNDAEKELTAKEERHELEQTEEQDKLSEQDAAIEEELQQELHEELPEDSNDEIREAASPSESNSQAPNGGSGKVWMIVSAVLALALVLVLIMPLFGTSNDTVATVNGVNIKKDKLYDELVKAGGPATLDNLITQQLIYQEAEANSITISDADVDAEIELIKKNFESDEQFSQALIQNNTTLENLKRDIKFQLTITKILEPKTDVTDAEVQTFYDENKEALGTPEQIQASHILVATKEEADAILAELKQGGDFAAIATAKSTDTLSQVKGGDLGLFPRGKMVPEFEEAAFALKINEISAVVQTEHGFHIIKKTAEQAAVVPTFEEKKAEIKKQLVSTEANELSEAWMTEIRAKAKITNKLTPEAPVTEEVPAAE